MASAYKQISWTLIIDGTDLSQSGLAQENPIVISETGEYSKLAQGKNGDSMILPDAQAIQVKLTLMLIKGSEGWKFVNNNFFTPAGNALYSGVINPANDPFGTTIVVGETVADLDGNETSDIRTYIATTATEGECIIVSTNADEKQLVQEFVFNAVRVTKNVG